VNYGETCITPPIFALHALLLSVQGYSKRPRTSSKRANDSNSRLISPQHDATFAAYATLTRSFSKSTAASVMSMLGRNTRPHIRGTKGLWLMKCSATYQVL